MQNNKKNITNNIQQRIQKYCAIEERCEFDIRKKLTQWEVKENTINEIIETLIKERFLNEERFVIMFCEVKLRTRKWGRIKIMYELKKRYISEHNIKKGLATISEAEYIQILKELLQNKSNSTKEANPLKKRQKIVNFLLQRGFESNLIWDYIDSYN